MAGGGEMMQGRGEMNEMVEKIARAIAANKRGHTTNSPVIDQVWTSYVGQARVAIEAAVFDDRYFSAMVKSLGCRDDAQHRAAVKQVHEMYLAAALEPEENRGK